MLKHTGWSGSGMIEIALMLNFMIHRSSYIVYCIITDIMNTFPDRINFYCNIWLSVLSVTSPFHIVLTLWIVPWNLLFPSKNDTPNISIIFLTYRWYLLSFQQKTFENKVGKLELFQYAQFLLFLQILQLCINIILIDFQDITINPFPHITNLKQTLKWSTQKHGNCIYIYWPMLKTL